MWYSSGDDKVQQVFSFDPTVLKNELEFAKVGRARHLKEGIDKAKEQVVERSYALYEEHYTERRWWRLFIKRTPKFKAPTRQELDQLTPEWFKNFSAVRDRCYYPMSQSDQDKVLHETMGDLGLFMLYFGGKARSTYWDYSHTGQKWVGEWQALARRLAGPPPSELVQISGEILSSLQHYAALGKG